MGKIAIGKTVIASGQQPLELDGIPFRSDRFVTDQYLMITSDGIVTGPAGGNNWPTKPFRIVGGVAVEYDTIQNAINASDNGDIIYVPPGEYYEEIAVDRAVTLKATACGEARLIGDTTIASICRLVGFSFEDQVVVDIGSPPVGSAKIELSEIQRLVIQNGRGKVQIIRSRIIDVQHDSNGIVDFVNCFVGGITGAGTGAIFLYDSYLWSFDPDTSLAIHHSGGSAGNFPVKSNYICYNFPWAANPGDVIGYDGRVWKPVPAGTPGPHAATHQSGGIDEVDVSGLRGRLADYQSADRIGDWPVDLTSTPHTGYVLTWDGEKIIWAECSGGSAGIGLGQVQNPSAAVDIVPDLSVSSVPA